MAWPPPHFPRLWHTSIAIAPLDYRQTFCKRNAISSARILTNGSISPASFTPNGSSPIKKQSKNRPSRKHRRRITQGNSCSRLPVAARASHREEATALMKIVRLASDQLFMCERPELARFDQNDPIRTLHYPSGKQRRLLGDHEP